MLKRLFLFIGILLTTSPMLLYAKPLDKVVAIVNDDIITESELNAEVDILKQQIAAKHATLPEAKILRKQVLQHLINLNLQLQLAKQNNLSIDNNELNDAIAKIAAANHLSVSELRQAIAQEGLTWEKYQENIRKEMLISQVQQRAISKDIQISQEQVEDYLKSAPKEEDKQRYHLLTLLIPLEEEPTSTQLKKAQGKAQDLLLKLKKGENFSQLALSESDNEFTLEETDLGERRLVELPELFAKHAAKMKISEVVGPLRTGNGLQLIKLLPTENPSERHEVLKTHVRHILLKPDNNLTPEDAKKQAFNIYQQLQSGKDFSQMAKQYSSDSLSARKGGDLGWVNPGDLVPEFEKVMDKLPPHQTSHPVKSLFGWHIIEVLERKKIDDSLAVKRQQIRAFLQQRKFAEAVQNWQQHLRAVAYVNIMEHELA